jgi:hypothetical protein
MWNYRKKEVAIVEVWNDALQKKRYHKSEMLDYTMLVLGIG